MASNDYFGNHPSPGAHPSPYHDYSDRRGSPSPYQITPPTSGKPYPYLHQTPAQSAYSGIEGGYLGESDPFDDNDAIPLSSHKRTRDSTQTNAPILQQEQDDPFVRDIDPRRPRRPPQDDGWFRGKITWVVYALTLVQLIVFLAEIIKNGVLTKSPIEIHPSFNPMIGPSPYVLINFGARYQPCMHNMANVQNSTTPIFWPCPNATTTTGAGVSCSLSELCGFGGVPNPQPGGSIDQKPAPNQWWRFIVPIFIHAGIVHIGFNLLLQLTLGRDIEKLIGSVRFTLVYFAAGIFGFVLGGNFAANGIASCGCSGSLFGILALTLLDLLYTWKQRPSPVKDLLFILLDCVIAFVLGLLPGLDNFSHIGGFLMGLVLGVCLLRSPQDIARRRSGAPPASYPAFSYQKQDSSLDGFRGFVKEPLGFFQNRRGVWWAWWLLRAVALVGAFVAFIVLLKNFYVWKHGCSWCKYLSCLPIQVGSTNWCTVGNLDFTPTSSTPSKRALFDLSRQFLI